MSDSSDRVEPQPTQRLASLDAYRGVTMLLLAFTAANWGWEQPIADAHPWLRPLTDQVEHAEWRGLTLWDMIQPSFMFMVGVSLPYSYASRKRRGASDGQLWRHAATRALLLVLLGVFLRSIGHDETHWTLEDVVSQIGLGYLPLFWLATRGPSTQIAAIAMTLVATWLLCCTRYGPYRRVAGKQSNISGASGRIGTRTSAPAWRSTAGCSTCRHARSPSCSTTAGTTP